MLPFSPYTMVSRTQYLLGKFAEEAVEVSQRAMKAQLFGLDDSQEGHADNYTRLKEEFNDFLGVVEELGLEVPGKFGRDLVDSTQVEAKRLKLRKYEACAGNLGNLGYLQQPTTPT